MIAKRKRGVGDEVEGDGDQRKKVKEEDVEEEHRDEQKPLQQETKPISGIKVENPDR